MTQNWGYSGGPPVLGEQGVQTLVAGSLFCVSTGNGDISNGALGLFFRDLRTLSRWELRVDGHSPQALAAYRLGPHAATYVSRVPPPSGRADSHLLVLRDRALGDGMREHVVVRNLGHETAGCSIALLLDADFADVFEVKENRVVPHPERVTTDHASDGSESTFAYHWLGHRRVVRVRSEPSAAGSAGVLTFAAAIPPGQQWETTLEVTFGVDGAPVPPRFPPMATANGHTVADAETREDAQHGPRLSSANTVLNRAFAKSVRDLQALRLQDPGDPDREVIAAGAPWFMTVFGRDSLLTAWMTLPFFPDLTLGTLQTLASRQGTRVDPLTEEEPGRILHEMRFGTQAGLALGGGHTYYGTADATSLFVMLLGEAYTWGLPTGQLDELLPHADAALEWTLTYGDKDRDGFVEYHRATDQGLLNQGWKDSFDGISFADGTLATAPIALCEVQGYTYAAYAARAAIARRHGDEAAATRWEGEAARLKQAFNEAFWLPDRGWYAVALDRDKNRVDSLTSNIGHCLWSGVVDEDKAPRVVEHLMSDEMRSGWGVRTLATGMGAYNPLSYHNGSVWPHDNALVVAGLCRYGFFDEAQTLTRELADAGATFDGRLPELFSGFSRKDFPAPVPYPTSCSPQAWAAATPFLLLRSLLGMQPEPERCALRLAPRLPDDVLPLRLSDVRVGGTVLRVEVDHEGWEATPGSAG